MKNFIYFFTILSLFFSSCTVADNSFQTSNKLSKTEYKTLKKNGFYIEKTNFDNIYSLYKYLSRNNEPLLYTVDLPLYSMHLIFDQTLKDMELNSLYDSLTVFTRELYKINYNKFENSNSPALRNSYYLLTLYFALPLSYLDEDFVMPDGYSKIINAEQMLIEAHKGISISPIFSYKEDYSQYIPRGHYNFNDSLKNYFKSFMWYGRMGFYFSPEHSFINATDYDSARIRMIKASVLVYSEIKGNKRLNNIWKYINSITNFYVGKSDDISLNTYDIYTPPQKLTDSNIMNFITIIKNNAPLPKIISTEKTDSTTSNKNFLCFKLFGQKYIPDSYIFQNLVYNKVLTYTGPSTLSPFTIGPGGIRAFPMGLDVASVLGSSVADDILKRTANSNYIGYRNNISRLKSEFSNIKPNNGYTYFLKFMQLMINRKQYKHDPIYMKSKLWAKKILTSVLSFWTMLRHDTILYSKQSYTAKLTSVVPHRPKKTIPAYLSPYGKVYKEMFLFCDTLSYILKTDKQLYNKWQYRLSDCKSLLLLYIDITNKEMTGKHINDNTMKKLYNSWKTWKDISEPRYTNESTPSDMSLVADVHTDINTKMVLEEAVGAPFKINAIAKSNGKNILFSGGINSYYEFKYPMDKRLTDEKWRAIKNSMPLTFWEEDLLIEE